MVKKKKGAKKKKIEQGELPPQLPFPGGLPERPEIDEEPEIKPLRHRVWTENKAKLIERYLLYFVFITHHGTYIDGFAGPQESDHPEMWSANLVLANEPKWLRHFHLFDNDPEQVKRLEELKLAQPPCDSKGRKVIRDIEIYPGDFNVRVDELLTSGTISEREATFCLLDQRSTECHWATVESLARYKPSGFNKIELFYFLAVGWLSRTLSATTRDTKRLTDWWGRDDWEQFIGMKKPAQAEVFVRRFKKEFGYKSVKAWPIFEKQSGGNIMYYMIHATDHKEAPKLMSRAYDRAVFSEQYEQLQFESFFSELEAENDNEPD